MTILGFVRTRLFKVDVPSEFPRDSQNLEIRHKIDLPSDDTTYWCSTHKLPNVFKRKHHAVQVSPYLEEKNNRIFFKTLSDQGTMGQNI